MVKFKVEVDINQPPAIVNQALMIPENAVYWTRDLEKFEVVKGKAGEAGSVARLHYVQKGRKHIMMDVMEYSEPGRRYVSRVSGPALTARVETTIESKNGGTRMAIAWDGTGKKLLLHLLLPLLRKKIYRHAKEELNTFKRLVETHGADFSKGGKDNENGP